MFSFVYILFETIDSLFKTKGTTLRRTMDVTTRSKNYFCGIA